MQAATTVVLLSRSLLSSIRLLPTGQWTYQQFQKTLSHSCSSCPKARDCCTSPPSSLSGDVDFFGVLVLKAVGFMIRSQPELLGVSGSGREW